MTGILYLAKNGLALYDEKTKGIFQLNFQAQVVKDLEIINPDQLNLTIKSLVASNKITPSALILVVSRNMFFEKDILPLPKEQQEIETQKFLDNVPFETIRSKVFQSVKTNKIVATNGHFIESAKKAFETLGFTITIAIPSMAFGILDEGLNQETIKLIFSKYASLKQYNLLNSGAQTNSHLSQKESEGEVKDEKNKEKTSKKNLIAIGMFVLLIVILSIIVFFVLSSQNSLPIKKSSLTNTKLIVKIPMSDDNRNVLYVSFRAKRSGVEESPQSKLSIT